MLLASAIALASSLVNRYGTIAASNGDFGLGLLEPDEPLGPAIEGWYELGRDLGPKDG